MQPPDSGSLRGGALQSANLAARSEHQLRSMASYLSASRLRASTSRGNNILFGIGLGSMFALVSSMTGYSARKKSVDLDEDDGSKLYPPPRPIPVPRQTCITALGKVIMVIKARGLLL